MGGMDQPAHTPPSVFRTLLQQSYEPDLRRRLYKTVKDSPDWVQRLGYLKILPIHSGCVNCICWSDSGDKLLSGSDDQHLVVTDAYNYKVLSKYKTCHRANIFSAKFLPCTNDTGVVSCSGDGILLYTDLLRLDETRRNIFNCHGGTTYEVAVVPNCSHVFMSCGEDCTVRQFDLRIKKSCTKSTCIDDIVICGPRATTALAVNQANPNQIATGSSDSYVRIYDRRMHTYSYSMGDAPNPICSFTAPGMSNNRTYRITSLTFSPKGDELLTSYSSEHLYLFGLKDSKTKVLSPEFGREVEDRVKRTLSPPMPPVRRLRLRGDWSDTGPDARPSQEMNPSRGGATQARPSLQNTLMQRMTEVLSRMLNDPATRLALSHGDSDYYDSGTAAQPEVETPEQEENDLGATEGDRQVIDLGEEAANLPEEDNFGRLGEEPYPTDPLEDLRDTVPLNISQASQSVPTSPTQSDLPQTPPSNEGASSSVTTETDAHSSISTLSNICHGLIERHGTEPMVNLVYSPKGSTASTISVSVNDDAQRQQPRIPQPENEEQSSSSEPLTIDDDSDSPVDNIDNTDHADSVDIVDNIGNMDIVNDEEDDVLSVASEENIHCHRFNPTQNDDDLSIVSDDDVDCSRLDDLGYERIKVPRSYFKQKYTGHRNARTMIKEANFWGDNYVISGSDCGHVFMWEKSSGRLKMLLEADRHVVNCLQPHPSLPILATSGIDHDVKLWAPVHENPRFDFSMAEELMKRNALMLEETKDTITVPASFMIRMLACLNQIRRNRTGGSSDAGRNSE